MMREEIALFPGRGLDSNIYLLKKQKTVIDTGSNSRRTEFRNFLEKHGLEPREIEYVFLTHLHKDHTGKVDMFKNAKIYSGKSKGRIEKAPNALQVDNIELGILETPGHTQEAISIFIPNWNVIFTGDTKFSRLVWGRTDLPGGDAEELEESIKKINWKPWYLLLPGHQKPYKRDKYLGIDLAVDGKTGLCFIEKDNIELRSKKMSIRYIKEAVKELKPNIIAVDAPLSRTDNPYREAEEKMKEEGFNPLPLNTKGMRELMEKGTRLQKELEEDNFFVIETHPSSNKKSLGKSAEDVINEMGFNKSLSNEHEKDAFLACIAAYLFPRGEIKIFGEEDKIVTAFP